MHEEELDEPIVPLVEALNRIPGVITFSSCGGHDDWRERCACAVPADQFWVSFDIEPTQRGWKALELIAWAVARYGTDSGDPECIDTVVWYSRVPARRAPSRGRGMAFQLNGRNSADPSVFAILLDRASRVARTRGGRRG